MANLPKQMKALRYEKPEDWSIVEVPLPELRPNDILIKVRACGVCGTDLHIHEGEFIAKFPLIPGHETVGVVAAVGPEVKGFQIGDRVAADNSELCNECFYCRRGELLLCEKFEAHGDNPYGFDVVVEATGSTKILEDAIHYVRRGGKLVVYGVYAEAARVSWPPSKIFGDEITILGSFSETYMFPATIDYLDSGKVRTAGIVNKTFRLEQFGEALESIRNKSAIKAAIVFDDATGV
ncbi:NADH-ubiquinone oxidoreductase 23 kDa subunit [Verticillium dahliae VDG1]|nr:NADH-ubiquinone oxidoreductase 23 kDa subunit [Verticillium dahliae VDG1]